MRVLLCGKLLWLVTKCTQRSYLSSHSVNLCMAYLLVHVTLRGVLSSKL